MSLNRNIFVPYRFAEMKSLSVFLIPVIIQAFFLYTSISGNHTTTRDSQEYLNQAYNILHHQTFYCGEPGQPVTDVTYYSRRPPGYGVFILITSLFLTFPALTLIIQSILSIFNIYLTYVIAKALKPDFKHGWVIVLLISAYFPQFILAATFMTEIPFQTAILLSAVYLLRYERADGAFRHLYLHHFFIFCAYMFKPIAGLLWVLSAFYLVITQNESRSVVRLSILSFMHLVVMVFSMMRNYHYTGIAEGSSIPHKVFVNYNVNKLLQEAYGPETATSMMDSLQHEMHNQPYPIQSAIADQFIRHQLSQHKLAYLKIHLLGMIKFFIDPGRWEIEVWKNGWQAAEHPPSLKEAFEKNGISGMIRESGSTVVAMTLLSLLSATTIFIFIIRWFFSRNIALNNKLFIAGIVLYFSFMTGPSASGRFRIPVMPLLLAAAAIGLSTPVQQSRSHKPE